MTTPILTNARLSLWRAIDNWEPLRDAFKSKWKFENDVGKAFEKIDTAGIRDYPAVQILPFTVQSAWVLNTMMEFTDAYVVDIRAPLLSVCEQLVESTWEAIYQAGETPAMSYVRQETGYNPKVLGPIQRSLVQTGSGSKVTVWKFELAVGLRLRKDPFGR